MENLEKLTQTAEIIKSMGTPLRLKILFKILEQGKIQPVNLTNELKEDSASISRELRIMKNAGILEKMKDQKGVATFYSIKSEIVKDMLNLLKEKNKNQ